MDRVLVRISRGQSGSFSRPAPMSPLGTKGSALAGVIPAKLSTAFYAYILAAAFGGMLLLHFLLVSSPDASSPDGTGYKALRSSLRSVPPEAILQAQLAEKDREVERLRQELERVRGGVYNKEDSVQAAGQIISELRAKAAAEADARTKAQLALADRADALHACQAQKQALAGEVAQCHLDMSVVLSGEAHRAAALRVPLEATTSASSAPGRSGQHQQQEGPSARRR